MSTRCFFACLAMLQWASGLAWGQASEAKDKLPLPPDGKTWKMVWSDEFEGQSLNEANWETPPDGPRHAGWWMRKAVSMDGQGHLVITTFRDGDKIIDGCVRTKGKFTHAFGYYVARVQLPKEQGHWPAFWLFEGCHVTGTNWWNGAEIDIMEKFWPNDEVKHTIFWDALGNHQLQSQEKIVTVPGIREGWHTFAVWRKTDAYVFYVDGKETWRTTTGSVIHVPQYIKLSDETDTWCKDIAKAKLPDVFIVDYVRVYDLMEGEHR